MFTDNLLIILSATFLIFMVVVGASNAVMHCCRAQEIHSGLVGGFG